MSGVNFNNKGNAAKIKACLDSDKQKDLRTNHFEIGGGSAKITNSVQ